MQTKDAIAHFGTAAALARALNIKPQSLQDWGDTVPSLRQLQLEQMTNRALKADPSVLNPRAEA
jgi:hypothetical protein